MTFKIILSVSLLIILALDPKLLVLVNAGNGIRDYRATFRFPESFTVGTKVGSLDKESILVGSNKQSLYNPQGPFYEYEMSPQSPYFTLNSQTSELKIKKELDVEELCEYLEECPGGKANLTLFVNVKAQQSTGVLALIRVHVIVEDVDDNDPKFNTPKFVKKLPELLYTRDKTIVLPQAIDADISPANNNITYHLLAGKNDNEISENDNDALSTFKLVVKENKLVYLELLKSMDYETQSSYNLVLKAWNNKKPNAAALLPILIEVTDMNDNPPEFDKMVYTIKLPENTPRDAVIYKLNATDKDKNDKLTYSYGQGVNAETQQTFRIEPDGRIILQKSLDYEKRTKYKIRVKVSDDGYHADSTLIVMVTDVNDEPPSFTLHPSVLKVNEESIPNGPIGQVTVTDADGADINGKVSCAEPSDVLGRQPIRFDPDPAINPMSGKYDLYVRNSLNREALPSGHGNAVVSRLICKDGENQQLRMTATLTASLTVIDINDNKPVFSKPNYSSVIAENNSRGAFIILVNATDLDEGQNSRLTYFFENENSFQIDEITGQITAAKEFDRETQDSYKVNIYARDNGNPSYTATTYLDVQISDKNDHAPQVLGSTEFSVLENKPPGLFIGQLNAVDMDLDANGRVSFTLLPAANTDMFRLMENGSLFSAVKFDREKISQHNLKVRISDHNIQDPQSSFITATINIMDENDNPPVFQSFPEDTPGQNATSRIHLSINESPGYTVLNVIAHDPDQGSNGRVHYFLGDNSMGGCLSLAETSGELQLVQRLNSHHIGKHLIVIVAEDQGSPKLSAKKVITIIGENTPARGDSRMNRNGTQGSRNIMIVIILSSVSAFLASVLITAILCMVRPCSYLRGPPRGGHIDYTPATAHLHAHQLYDMHGGGGEDVGMLYGKKFVGSSLALGPGGTLGPVGGYHPADGLLNGMDGGGMGGNYLPQLPPMGNHCQMTGCPEQNWSLPPNSHQFSGPPCLESNRGSSSPQSERHGTLPSHKLTRANKKNDQVRLWAYESNNCGKFTTLAPGRGNGGPGAPGEEQSDSGRGGSDEELCHHGPHTNTFQPSMGTLPPNSRGYLMQTFQTPPSPAMGANNSFLPSVTSLSSYPQSTTPGQLITQGHPMSGGETPLKCSYLQSQPATSTLPRSTLPRLVPQTTNNGSQYRPTPPQYTPSTNNISAGAYTTNTGQGLARTDPDNRHGSSEVVVTTTATGDRATSYLNSVNNSQASTNLYPPTTKPVGTDFGGRKKPESDRLCDEIDNLFFKDML